MDACERRLVKLMLWTPEWVMATWVGFCTGFALTGLTILLTKTM